MAPQEIAARAFAFACRILRLCDFLMKRGGVGVLIGRQLAEAGTSVGANLEEAKGAQTRPDFVAKACVALKEAREAWYWLRLVDATTSQPPHDAKPLLREADEIVAILTTVVKNARSASNHR